MRPVVCAERGRDAARPGPRCSAETGRERRNARGGERARCEVPQWLASLSERFGLYSVHRGDPLKRE